MDTTKYIWMNGKFVLWEDAKVHVLTHTLHYGDGAFEGIRAYKTDKGGAVFRLKEHMDRLVYSASVLGMTLPYSVEELCEATCELLSRNDLAQGYIRPLAIHGYGVMGLNPRNSPVELIIACWPWGAYLPVEAADIKVSKYIRIHPKSTVADAKICGHYVNSILAVLELKGTKYHEALFLDQEGAIAEGPGENFFLVKRNEIVTPPLGTILAGITRSSVMEIARDLGFTITERKIMLDEVYAADEAFFTGTAAEVTPIGTIDDKVVGNGKAGPATTTLKQAYLDVVHGRNPQYSSFLTYLE
ncbi:MAG: Branched-chain-amino-acid aminotransferase [Pseudomonadota bacterium]|jgi:branched-chain amino acid aminotransferase